MRKWWNMLASVVLGSVLAMGINVGARAADFCCKCSKDKSISIEAKDELTGGLECSVKCKKPVKAKAGKCEAPAAPASSAAPTPSSAAPAAKGGKVLLFATEDCSGDAKSISATSGKLSDQGATGIRSYQVESGEAATGFEKADFGGRRIEPVGAGLCVSPGFEVNAIRIGK